MLFDPAEEQFNAPATAIEFGDGERGKGDLVGEEDQRSALLCIMVLDAPKCFGIVGGTVNTGEPDGLIADHSGGTVDPMGIEAAKSGIGFSPQKEEAAGLMQAVETGEVEIAAIHDVEGSGLGQKQVQDVDVMELAVGNVNECRDMTAQIEERMKLDGRFGFAKMGPREQRQAKINGGGVQSIDRVGNVQARVFVDVKAPCRMNQTLSEIGVEAPVPPLIGVGQGVA